MKKFIKFDPLFFLPTSPYTYKFQRKKIEINSKLFYTSDYQRRKPKSEIFYQKKKVKRNYENLFENEYFDDFDQPVNYCTWEDEIIYDENDLEYQNNSDINKLNDSNNTSNSEISLTNKNSFISTLFNTSPWEQQIIYNSTQINPNFEIFLNNQELIFSPYKKNNVNYNYNISMDKYYNEIKRKADNPGISHQFKISFSSENQDLFFSKKKFSLKVTNLKNNEILSLTDNSIFGIFEYAEEEPIIKQKKGMGSMLIEYTDFIEENQTEKNVENLEDFNLNEEESNNLINDNSIPKSPCNHQNTGNSANSGNIKTELNKSEFVPVQMLVNDDPFPVKLREPTLSLVTNLSRGRVYKHTSSDFLLIFHNNSISIKCIKIMYLVGQVFPSEEIFSPSSRRLNIFCKNRLKQFIMFYCHTFKKDKRNSENKFFIPANVIDKQFPNFTDGSKKKWLKEYTDSVRKENVLFYTLKKENLISYQEMENLVPPEQICLFESIKNYDLSKNYLNFRMNKSGLNLKNDYTGKNEGIGMEKGDDLEIPYELWDKEKLSLSNQNYFESEYFENNFKEELESKQKKESFDSKIKNKEILNKKNVPHIVITRIIKGKIEKETIYDSRIIEELLSRNNKKEFKKSDDLNITDSKSTNNSKVLKCGACGQSGHMKTNKICPFYISAKKKNFTSKKAKILLNNLILQVISNCSKLPHSSAFSRPVSLKKFPDYKIIENPIDLGTMKGKCKIGYEKFDNFLNDIKLMKDNCIIYNGKEHGLSKLAEKMEETVNEFYLENKDRICEYEGIISNIET